MAPMLAMLMQSAGVSGPVLPVMPVPVRLTPPPDCPVSDSGDIVVCSRREHESYRLKPLPDRYARDAGVPRAALRIGGNATLSAETESATVGGFTSKRAMAKFKLKF